MYALIQDGVVVEYPCSIPAWREANRTISLPAEPTEVQLNEVGIFNVAPRPRPLDQMGKVVEELLPVEVDGVWTQTWAVRDATPGELAQQQQELTDSIVAATQQRLDDFARTRGYDGILSACTYATSPTDKFQTEGQYCVISRDATWAKLYQMLAEVQAGTRPIPSGYADIEPELPPLVWPN